MESLDLTLENHLDCVFDELIMLPPIWLITLYLFNTTKIPKEERFRITLGKEEFEIMNSNVKISIEDRNKIIFPVKANCISGIKNLPEGLISIQIHPKSADESLSLTLQQLRGF
jgi:hypothetical protein